MGAWGGRCEALVRFLPSCLCLESKSQESMTAERWEPLPPTEAHQNSSSGPGDMESSPALPRKLTAPGAGNPPGTDPLQIPQMQIKVRIERTSSERGGYRCGHQSPRCGSAMAAARTAVAMNRNADPDGNGDGGQRRGQCTELLQEGCSSEKERGLVADFAGRFSLVPGPIDSCR